MTSVTVCIATMKRESIVQTLESLDAQQGLDGVTLDVVVADNDETPSARARIESTARRMSRKVTYVHAPARNISIARNAGLDNATGDWAAFIDDDEVAAPNWIARLLATARDQGAQVVLGPATAVYPDETPVWIRDEDYHTNKVVYRDGVIQTGHTCNAMIARTHPDIVDERFLLSKGKTGGEDTEFFFRLWRKGLKIVEAADAEVFEPVNPARLTFEWISQRKFRAGQSFGYHAGDASFSGRLKMAISSILKIIYCGTRALVSFPNETRRKFWILRGIMHAGIVSSAFGTREAELYG